AGIVYYGTVLLLRDGLRAPGLARAGAGLALLGVARLTYWPAGFAVLVAVAVRWRGAALGGRAGGLVCLALPLLTAGGWIGRNERLYGQWAGGAASLATQQRPVGPLPEVTVTPTDAHVPSKHPALYRYGLGYLAAATFMSFWGVFGYMGLLMPAAYYGLWGLPCLAALVGLALAVARLGGHGLQNHPRLPVLAAFVTPLVLVLLGHVYLNLLDPGAAYQPQGRYLFGALLPIFTLMVLGLQELLRAWGRDRWLLPLCLGSAAAANGWCLWGVATAPWARLAWAP